MELVILVALLLAVSVPFLLASGGKKQSSLGPEEPRLVSFYVPYVGAFAGLVGYGVSFYEKVRDKCGLSIYSIYILTQKFYIVTSPELISQINRKHKTISNEGPFIETVYGRLLSLDAASLALVRATGSQQGSSSSSSLWKDSHVMYHQLLKPGPAMKQMYVDTASAFPALLRAETRGPRRRVDLMEVVKRTVSLALASALYGPDENPFALDAGLLDDFWAFEDGTMMLVLDLMPALTAPKAVRGRQRMVDAFKRYHDRLLSAAAAGDQGPKKGAASHLVGQLTELSRRYRCSDEHIARAELGLFLGLTISTVPAMFWLIALVIADAVLLAEIRDELAQAIAITSSSTTTTTSPPHTTATLDMSAMKQKCPVLVSTLREVLRYTAAGIAAFEVREDTVLDDGRGPPTLLKKGAALQIPATAVHTDPAVWGDDAALFVPRRFLKDAASKQQQQHHTHPAAFRTFGGGASLCPGRHLAEDMMLTMAAVVLASYDFKLAADVPKPDRTKFTSMMKPASDLPLVLSCKEGWEKTTWSFL